MAAENLKRNLTLVGIVFIAIAIPLTIVAINIASDIFTGAEATEEPKEIFVTNQGSSSATITWLTPSADTSGFVQYGVNPQSLNQSAFDERDTGSSIPRKSHSVVLKNLNPGSTYHFKFIIGGQEYDNGGLPYQFKTFSVSQDPATPNPINGSISPSVEDVLIYAYAFNKDGRTNVVSTLTNSSGRYSFDAANFRENASGQSFDLNSSDIFLFAQAVKVGVGKAQFIAKDDPPTVNISTANTFHFDPDQRLDLLPRTGTSPTPTPAVTPGATQNATVQQMIKSSINIAGFDKNSQVPNNIRISNISDTSFTVSWLTKERTIGYILYGLSTPNKPALDVRDGSISSAKRRFTHSVTIQEPGFTAGTKLNFQIVSNDKIFGDGSSPFQYAIPPVLSNPPGIQTVSGSVTPAFTPGDLRDYIIMARLATSAGSSSLISAVPSASGTYTLNLAAARTESLDSTFSVDDSTASLALNGEFNSSDTSSIDDDGETADFNPETGLSIANLTQGEVVPRLDSLEGTAAPGSTVNIAVVGPQAFTGSVGADASGNWDVSLSNVNSPGEYQIDISSDGEVLGMSAQLNLQNLPEAGIRDDAPYFVALIPLALGIYAIYIAKMRRKR